MVIYVKHEVEFQSNSLKFEISLLQITRTSVSYQMDLLLSRPRGPLMWLDPGAFGTLGVGGGFALGAKLCRPESQVGVRVW